MITVRCRRHLVQEIRRSICFLPLKENRFTKRFSSVKPNDYSQGNRETVIYVNWVDSLKNKPLGLLEQLYTKELDYFLANTSINIVGSILFGCNTIPPSPEIVKHLLMLVEHKISPATEIMLESDLNYHQINMNKLWEYRASGINRICLRITDHNTLKEHKEAIAFGVDIFPDALSVDLCSTLECGRQSDWNCMLLELANSFSHIKIEEYSESAQALIWEESFLQQYHATQQVLADFGFKEYKFCHFAKSNRARSRFMTLLSQGAQYVGLGPLAHGRLNHDGSRLSYVNETDCQQWRKCLLKKSNAIRALSALTKSEIVCELLLQGLDTEHGIPIEILKNYLSNLEMKILLQNGDIKECIKHGFLLINIDTLAIPQSAWLVSNAVIVKLLNALKI